MVTPAYFLGVVYAGRPLSLIHIYEVGGIVQDIDASEAKVINGYIDEVNKVRGTS